MVAEVLKIDQEDVHVIMPTSRGNGVSVCVLWLHPRTNFLEDWCAKSTVEELRAALQREWSNKVRSAGSEGITPENGSSGHGIPGAWVRVYRGIGARLRAAKITTSLPSAIKEAKEKELEGLVTGLPEKMRSKIQKSADYDICGKFIEYALRVGLQSNDPREHSGE